MQPLTLLCYMTTGSVQLGIIIAFLEKFVRGMSGVIGCVRCTYIPVHSSGGNETECYCCRDVYFPANMEGIGDPDLKFANMASWTGNAFTKVQTPS